MSDTLDTLRSKVEMGMEIARRDLAEEPELLALVELAYAEWQQLFSGLIIQSTGLWASKFRSKEGNIQFFKDMAAEYKAGLVLGNLPEC